MNKLDRYAVSLENMEVLRDQIDEQAREIALLTAEVTAYEEKISALRPSATGAEWRLVPEGWVLVPVEPTKAMLFACEDAGSIHNQKRGKRIYQAMLAAAPSAGSQGGDA